eukprot:COSAG02_NODE_955_length_15680_cov_31.906681_6_plen_549_part_00
MGGKRVRGMSTGAAFARWDQRDIDSWRKELADAAQEDESRLEKAFTLLVAATSYVAAGGWSAWVKKYACFSTEHAKAGALCQNMTGEEMIWFTLYCACATVVVAMIVWALYFLRDKIEQTVAKEADEGGALTVAEEKLVATKALKAVDLISGGWIYNSAALWSIALHTFLSYTLLSGAWLYFCLNLTFVFIFSMASWELAPVLTAWARKYASGIASDPSVAAEDTRAARIAKAFGGSMAWLLAIALMQALEVTIAVFWPTGNDEGTSPDGRSGATLVYYAGGLHNLPLVARWLLVVLTVGATLPLLIFEKRTTERPIRDALVGALMDRGEWDAAALLMRAFERLRGLLIPMLGYTGTQALFRAIDKTFTPHSYDIFFYPATPQQLMGQGSSNIANATAATEAAIDGGKAAAGQLGLSETVAGNVSHTIVLNATDTSSVSASTSLSDNSGNQDDLVAHDAGVLRIQDASAQAVADYVCEEEGECWVGKCCPYEVLWGIDWLVFIYAIVWTFIAAWFLTSRDRVMRRKLEHVSSSTRACIKTVSTALLRL